MHSLRSTGNTSKLLRLGRVFATEPLFEVERPQCVSEGLETAPPKFRSLHPE